MKIRYFVIFSIVYIAIIVSYGFYVTTDKYTLTNTLLFEFSITLPIALWLCLPAIVLFIIAWLFLSFAALYHKFKLVSFNRDMDKLVSQIQEQMLGSTPKDRVFSFNQFKELSKIIKRSYLLPNLQSGVSNNEKIDSIITSFIDIQNGLEQLKLKISQTHPMYNKNILNGVKSDAQKAFDILKQNLETETICAKMYSDLGANVVYDKAWDVILDSGNAKVLQKALNLDNLHFTFSRIFKLVVVCLSGKVEISKDLFIHACKSVTLSEREYLRLVIEICKSLNQNNISFWLSIFETLSKEIEASVLAYFYILLEVGKTKEAMDLKEQYPKDDFLPISAFISLKDKGYPLLVFFDPLLYRENKLDNTKFSEHIKQIDYIKH